MPALAFALLGDCQEYRFKAVTPEPVQVENQHVTIGARLKPPDIMILQDTSGSMCEPIQLADGTNGAIGNSCLSTDGGLEVGYCSFCQPGYSTTLAASTAQTDCDFTSGGPLPACATKMQLTANAMATVLNGLAPAPGTVNFGLTSFASQAACAPGVIQVPVGDATTTIPQIISFYKGVAPNGGTPTAATLAVAASDPTMSNPDPTARKFILLVTDGLPNCAPTSPCTSTPWSDGKAWGCASPALVAAQGSDAGPPAACQCSFGPCENGQNFNFCCPVEVGNSDEAWYCLDDQNAESELSQLFGTQNITTYVIGMGYDYGSNVSVLDAMADAGGGSPTAYQANTPAALAAAIKSLIENVIPSCAYQLDAPPVNPGLITVTLNGTALVAGDPNGYTFTPPTTITLNGSACAALTSLTGGPDNLVITALAN
jgi:hypothetical protein